MRSLIDRVIHSTRDRELLRLAREAKLAADTLHRRSQHSDTAEAQEKLTYAMQTLGELWEIVVAQWKGPQAQRECEHAGSPWLNAQLRRNGVKRN